jgi:hypothetical protein
MYNFRQYYLDFLNTQPYRCIVNSILIDDTAYTLKATTGKHETGGVGAKDNNGIQEI